MIWGEGLAIGLLVGMSGGLWLLLNITWIQAALKRGNARLAPAIGSLLTLPAFLGGGTWAANSALGKALSPEAMLAYLIGLIVIIAAMNAWPCYRLILWCARNIEGAP
ncbi:MAG: hypothetical protein JO261_07645 [Alphaproteobacteria bacterium]|nr:hypothetical protein [Alphaproteobacteria bacterium]MBV9693556.1 hypothetical protein [Alphaproteobacteria bacterium]